MKQTITSDDLLASIYYGTDQPIFLLDVTRDKDFRFAGLNPAHEQATGLRSEEIRGKTPEDLVPMIPSETAKAISQKYSTCLKMNAPYEYEEMIPFDGKETYWLTRLNPIRDKKGKICRIVGSATNITSKEKHLKEVRAKYLVSLKENEKVFRSMVENIQGIAYRFDLTGKPAHLYGSVESITGYSEKDLLEKGILWQELMPEEDVCRLQQTHPIENFRKPGYRCKREFRIRTRQGEIKWISDDAMVICDKAGRPCFIQGAIADISHLKEAEVLISESEKKYRNLFEHAEHLIHIVDPQGKIIEVNRFELKTLGYSLHEMEGKSFLDFVHPDNREQASREFKLVREGKKFSNYERAMITRSGRKVMVQTSVVPELKNGAMVSACAIMDDVTDLQRAGEELSRANEGLIEKNRELEQIVYVTSHDLRSPLVNIQGFNQEMERSIQELKKVLDLADIEKALKQEIDLILNEEIPDSIEFIKNGIRKMDLLLKGLLTISRLGRRPLELDTVVMCELISEVKDSFSYQLNESGAELEIGDLPECRGDANQLNQLFSNLFSNALKYSDPSRKLHIQIGGGVSKDRINYWIKDNGIGIPKQKHEKIFEIFHKHEPGKPGEGLGLTIVRKIAEKHFGRIMVESEPGKGSTFLLSLPNQKNQHHAK